MKAWVAGAAWAAMAGCALERAVYVVDAIEDGTVVLLDARGVLWTAPVAELPGVSEGDTIVDGRLDLEERARWEAEVRGLRARLASGAARDLDLTKEAP